MLSNPVPGIASPTFETIAHWHPQFALAAKKGVPVRPNSRTMNFRFSSGTPGLQPENANFTPSIGAYSIFTGIDVTIDPTGAFSGNVLKTTSDSMQAVTSGLLATLIFRNGQAEDWAAIANPTPLQMIPRILNPTAGQWALDTTAQAFGTVQVNAQQPADDFTVWFLISFLCLGPGGGPFLCMQREDAIRELARLGVFCCGPGEIGRPVAGA